MICCKHWRLTKKEIIDSLRAPLPPDTILCSDWQVYYKGHANDDHLKHIELRVDLKQNIKKIISSISILYIIDLSNELEVNFGVHYQISPVLSQLG